jgi:hypothetical protein
MMSTACWPSLFEGEDLGDLLQSPSDFTIRAAHPVLVVPQVDHDPVHGRRQPRHVSPHAGGERWVRANEKSI